MSVIVKQVATAQSQLVEGEGEERVQEGMPTGGGLPADAAAAEAARQAQAVVQSMVSQLNDELECLTGSQEQLRAQMAAVCTSRDALQVWRCALDGTPRF